MTGTDRKRSMRNPLWAKYSGTLPTIAPDFYDQLQIDENGILLTKNLDLHATRIDEVSADVTYIGRAKLGSATSASVWQIKKITTSGTETKIEFANGAAVYDQSWDARASLTYN